MSSEASRAELYLDAGKAVRLGQVLGRARRVVPASVLAAGPLPAPAWRPLAGGLGVDPAPQSGPQEPASQGGCFRAVGATRPATAPDLWTADAEGLLFLFHLHGFSELAADAATEQAAHVHAFWEPLLASWLDTCGRPAGPAWHPFPLSGRLIAWSAALSAGDWPAVLQDRMVASMQRQLQLLRRSVEHDIGGNHVIRNATALVVAGVCVGDRRAERAGLRVLRREVPRQVLDDGGHEERSPSYHREVLEDLRAVVTVLDRAGRPSPAWAGRLPAMSAWLAALTRPDGTVPLLNDAWTGASEGTSCGDELTDLAASGYVVLRAPGQHVVLDVGELGPRHLPAHVHADALAISLWADGRELIADPGVFAYTGPERNRFRGTAAHATVTVDGADQCCFWGPFRAGLLPAVRRTRTARLPGGWILVEAEHDGYTRLPDPVVHRRSVVWHPEAGLVIVDRLSCAATHRISSRLPLAPGVAAASRLGPFAVAALDGGAVSVERGRHSAVFGAAADTEVLVQEREVGASHLTGWSLLRGERSAQVSAGVLTVTGEPCLTLAVAAR